MNLEKFMIIDKIALYDIMNNLNFEINPSFDFINLILANFFAYLLIALLIVILKNVYHMIMPRSIRKWRLF
ncbi:MAG: hypothetical protein II309_01070 [Bacilli bacterium]|jgi:hypothetical protein|nr:hypothetical protein [Bacilli bacterium]